MAAAHRFLQMKKEFQNLMMAKGAAAVDQDNFPLLIAGRTLEMPIDTIAASMARQLVGRSSLPTGLTYYSTFKLYIPDIIEYLKESRHLDPQFSIDLFGDIWIDNFFDWKKEKNKPFCRDLVVTFPDGSEWSVRAVDIATLYAEKLLNDQEDSTNDTIFDLRDSFLENDEDLINWVNGNLEWDDVAPYAEEVKRPQPETNYSDAWQSSPKRMQPWEDADFVIGWLADPEDDNLDEE